MDGAQPGRNQNQPRMRLARRTPQPGKILAAKKHRTRNRRAEFRWFLRLFVAAPFVWPPKGNDLWSQGIRVAGGVGKRFKT